MNKKLYIGIDASIKCTGITIFKDNNYYFYYYNSDKVAKIRKLTEDNFLYNFDIENFRIDNKLKIIEDKKDFSDTIYYSEKADSIIKIINSYIDTNTEEIIIGLEGYALGGMGMIFNIAEFCGLLKEKLYSKINHKNKTIYIFKPTNIKKFATGKGNSKKPQMLKAFREINSDTTNKLLDIFNINNDEYTKNIKSPVEDLIDSYFICKKIMVSYK